MLPDYVTNCIHKISKSEGFIDYRIEMKDSSSHGDNFMGIMIATKLSGTRSQNGTVQYYELHLLCKIPPMNEIRQKKFNSSLVFERELYTYTKILPAFKKELKSVCFLDFQLVHHSAPVTDLMYNIFTGTDHEFRAQHYETLLKTYYTSLSETIKKLGGDPDKLYTYTNFRMQMKKFGDYALLFGILLTLFRIAKAKDVSNLDEYAECHERNDSVEMLGKFDDDTQAEFSRLMNGLLTDVVDYGYVKCEWTFSICSPPTD
ncbi:uncharacterized protein LOC116345872 [Contarinia nasturtii]|uniref:uncharacterized protein LOC116345872 n=1 Tax=Contarinia nasturtii TaxID=265458 RepID=UPI0012D3D462|nr:uncharacterized protein LOC116345872 [Contarinia nasturtii]